MENGDGVGDEGGVTGEGTKEVLFIEVEEERSGSVVGLGRD